MSEQERSGCGWWHTSDQIRALLLINETEGKLEQLLGSDAPEIGRAVQVLRDAISAYGKPDHQPAGR